MSRHIELDAPNLSGEEKRYLCDCIDSGFISTFGPYVSDFEKRFESYLGIERAVSVQSGTAALHIALHELGIGRGDEVITPALTFTATVNPVLYVGATPVFVDVDRKTWNINPDAIEEKITKRTKAIIPVHLYGNPCLMDEILKIARKHNIYVIEDATESLGAKYKEKLTGTFGDLGCFSFNGNKIITTGGGGMIVGGDTARLEHIKFLVNQAKTAAGPKGYYHPEIGFNYRMTNIEATLGLAQMERLDEFIDKKRLFSNIYHKELKEIKCIRFQEEYDGAKSVFWLFSVIFDKGVDISDLQDRLKERGIPSRRIFMPVVEFPPYKAYKRGEYRNSYEIYERALSLPASTLNSKDDIYYVCEVLKENL